MFNTTRILLTAIVCITAFTARAEMTIDVQTIMTHDDGTFLWFHPRACTLPDGRALMTLQQHLHKSDFYSGLYTMWSEDNGKTWTDPHAEPALAWRKDDTDAVVAVCDVTPNWHPQTEKVLAIGAKVRYRDGIQIYDRPQSRAAGYSVYDPKTDAWSDWDIIELPQAGEADSRFYNVTPGCVQWLIRDDGTVLIPIYFSKKDAPNSVTIIECSFDGEKLAYKRHGDELDLDIVRGLVEPQLTQIGDDYYLSLRNDERGYVTRGADGNTWEDIRPWTFDDGEELGSYNTQQHWVTHGEKLYLSYTRRGANNDHVFRNRAPLFIAEVDREKLHVIRSTERVLIPEKGAALGNFGVCKVNENESWVTVSEGVWNDDMRKRGATGDTFLARICWED